ncbi:hypothetical protein ACN94_21355 [Gordonia paraffinivorans]|nr:hypothetical protein [Gordonia paraffinivorans]
MAHPQPVPALPADPIPTTVAAPTTPGTRKSVVASTVGNLLEWYEWSAYAVFAPFIAAAMFDNSDPVSALLSTLAVFAVGFLVRPLGGIVFGRIADRRGRKFVLITTMLMMAAGSLAIGLLPTYASIGAGASALLLLIRIVQGFAHGGESATANSYIAELAPPHRRGLWGSVVFAAIFGGSVIAYTIGGGVTTILSESAVAEWGWRIPFLIGAVFAVVVLYLRRNMCQCCRRYAAPPADRSRRWRGLQPDRQLPERVRCVGDCVVAVRCGTVSGWEEVGVWPPAPRELRRPR